VSVTTADGLLGLGQKWWMRLDKGLSAVQNGFQSLGVHVARDVTMSLPIGAHRLFWSGACRDADLIEFLARELPDGGLFLDVGGNIGVYSAGLWKLRGNMHGVAFEPIPSTQALLKATFDLNGVPFSIERVAISEGPGVLKLSSYPFGLNNFWITEDDGRHPTTDVVTVSLDDWCGNDPQRVPGAIKIDVEGHELAVLRGARKILRTYRPAMVMECHAASWDELGVSRDELAAEIEAIGYKRVCDRAGRPVDFHGARQTFHLLGLP
jgi:FkbM family methyltransferase